MTTILVNVRDDSKVRDVVRFLKDIDFLEVIVQDEVSGRKVHRKPARELAQTRILGDLMQPAVPNADWEALRESAS